MREKTQLRTRSIEGIVLCGMFTALIATGAFIKINIPVQPFPMHFTLQFFFVLLAGIILGGKMGCTSVCCYLLIGLSGIPIFAAGGGPAYLIRPTFGFLLGFVWAALVTGKIVERMRRHTFLHLLLATVAGLAVMYLSGILYFYFVSNYVIGMPIGWKLVLINCFLLTVGGDFVLCVMASALAAKLIPMLQKIR